MRECEDWAERRRQRIHLITGLLAALANGHEVLSAIEAAEDPPGARAALMALPLRLPEDARAVLGAADVPLTLDEAQARLVLETRLARAARSERARMLDALRELVREPANGGPGPGA